MIRQRLTEILYFFRSNLRGLLLLTFPFALIGALVTQGLGEPLEMVGEKMAINSESAVALMVLYPFALGAKVAGIHLLAQGQPLAPATLLRAIALLWPVMFGISLVLGLAVGVGLMMLLFPAAWFYARLGYAPILAVTERRGVLDALREAWLRSRPQQVDLFLVTLLLGALLYAVGKLLALTLEGNEGNLAINLLVRTANELLMCLFTIAFYRYWSVDRAPQPPVPPPADDV